MKHLKIILAIVVAGLALWLAYSYFFLHEEWQTRKRCADCQALEDQKQQRLIGTVEILPNGKTVFNHQRTGLSIFMTLTETKTFLPLP